MTSVAHLTVSLAPLDPQWVVGRAVKHPAANQESTTYAFKVAGWVVGRQAPADRVEVVQDGRVIQTTKVDVKRPHIADRFPETSWAAVSGFTMMVDSLAFEPAFAFELRAVFADSVTVPLAVIQGQRRSLGSGDAQRLQPLIVTSLGRTGTTWMMRLLAEHPEIVAYRRYPYEVRPGTYWTHMLKVLAAPADYARQISHPHGFYADRFAVGANPFYAASLHEYPGLQEWSGRTYVEQLTQFCQNAIEEWYRTLAKMQEQPTAAYFAEKHLPHEYPGLLWELYPRAREIFLVRDFRDVACSILAFNARRGFDDFGRQHASSDEEFLYQLRHGGTSLLESWRSRSDRAHLVRYEDLIAAPNQTLGSLLAYVGVDPSPSTIDAMIERASQETPELRRHQTSETPAASIGRWRHDLDPGLQAKANELFSEILDRFGYDKFG